MAKKNTKPESVSNVKVLVRVRPRVQREIDLNSDILVSMSHKTTVLSPPVSTNLSSTTKEEKTFTFDESLWSCDSLSPHFKDQLSTYDSIGKEVLDHTVAGYNTCIFAYGQTGSGKSYTMMGDAESSASEMGIIPRACLELFEQIADFPKFLKSTVKISYFEIYNEQVRDLLDDSSAEKRLKVRENPITGPYVEQLNEFEVHDYQDILRFMKLGNSKRTVASTAKNNQSSRSHAIFTINLRITEFDQNLILVKERNSSLKLVDLAGSERSLGSQGLRLKEGNNINKSLTTLGRVISSLSDNSDSKPPFRDSILTWLLKENLNGNCKTVMIGCISPCDYDESLSTLRYATLVKKVELKAVKNIDEIDQGVKEAKFKEMQMEIRKLNQELLELKENDEMVNKINNMNNFFNDRLIDERNKSSLLLAKLNSYEIENRQLRKKINLLIEDINFDATTEDHLRNLQKRYQELEVNAVGSLESFTQQLTELAP